MQWFKERKTYSLSSGGQKSEISFHWTKIRVLAGPPLHGSSGGEAASCPASSSFWWLPAFLALWLQPSDRSLPPASVAALPPPLLCAKSPSAFLL